MRVNKSSDFKFKSKGKVKRFNKMLSLQYKWLYKDKMMTQSNIFIDK